MRRFGHQGKPDANTAAIVEELRKLKDVSVRYIGKPIDLIVGIDKENFLIEIKNPDGKDMRGESWEKQKQFIAEWKGSVAVCHSLDDVLKVIRYYASDSWGG